MKPSQTFHGIFPPMITPLNADFSLDVEHTEKLIEHLIDGGVHGIFIIGTTGESASISLDVKSDLIRLTCKQVNGRVPVLVGITDSAGRGTSILYQHRPRRADQLLHATGR
jgi:dihydrodipicolinate synthase/N-acetylneuraminate lyase